MWNLPQRVRSWNKLAYSWKKCLWYKDGSIWVYDPKFKVVTTAEVYTNRWISLDPEASLDVYGSSKPVSIWQLKDYQEPTPPTPTNTYHLNLSLTGEDQLANAYFVDSWWNQITEITVTADIIERDGRWWISFYDNNWNFVTSISILQNPDYYTQYLHLWRPSGSGTNIALDNYIYLESYTEDWEWTLQWEIAAIWQTVTVSFWISGIQWWTWFIVDGFDGSIIASATWLYNNTNLWVVDNEMHIQSDLQHYLIIANPTWESSFDGWYYNWNKLANNDVMVLSSDMSIDAAFVWVQTTIVVWVTLTWPWSVVDPSTWEEVTQLTIDPWTQITSVDWENLIIGGSQELYASPDAYKTFSEWQINDNPITVGYKLQDGDIIKAVFLYPESVQFIPSCLYGSEGSLIDSSTWTEVSNISVADNTVVSIDPDTKALSFIDSNWNNKTITPTPTSTYAFFDNWSIYRDQSWIQSDLLDWDTMSNNDVVFWTFDNQRWSVNLTIIWNGIVKDSEWNIQTSEIEFPLGQPIVPYSDDDTLSWWGIRYYVEPDSWYAVDHWELNWVTMDWNTDCNWNTWDTLTLILTQVW